MMAVPIFVFHWCSFLIVSAEDASYPYDYSCSQSSYPFIRAPDLRHAKLEGYDTRQNPINPYKYYLAARYRCERGYKLRDNRYFELYCSNMRCVGVRPICDKIHWFILWRYVTLHGITIRNFITMLLFPALFSVTTGWINCKMMCIYACKNM